MYLKPTFVFVRRQVVLAGDAVEEVGRRDRAGDAARASP